MNIKCYFPEQYAHMQADFLNIKAIFSEHTDTIHKARNELKIITIHETKTVTKSFRIPHWINRFIYTFFRKGKAYKSYFHALKLISLGISTPKPIALIEYYITGLISESYFISEYFDYDFTIRTPLVEPFNNRTEILRAFAAFTYDLHQKGVWHLDYSPGNILIKRIDGGYQFSIVDINRMKFRPITPIEGCENFNKLWASDEDIIIMAEEYARLSGLDNTLTIKEMKRHNDANKRIKNFKKRLKALFK